MTARTGAGPRTGRLEAVVAGGGPAGAVAALVLARAGRHVLLVDGGPPGARSGAFTIGETLPPAARPLLHDLGLWTAFAADAHLSCPGTDASWGSARLLGHSHLFDPHGHGWHLDRDRFDAFLREAAVAAGALIRRAVVIGHRSAGGEQRLLVRERGGAVRELCSRWVVDATGRRALIGRRLALRRRQDRLVAAFTLLGGRVSGGHAGDPELRTLVEAVPEGWWYTARVPAGRVVAHLTDADLAGARLRTAEGFRYAVARTRHVRDRLRGYDPACSPSRTGRPPTDCGCRRRAARAGSPPGTPRSPSTPVLPGHPHGPAHRGPRRSGRRPVPGRREGGARVLCLVPGRRGRRVPPPSRPVLRAGAAVA